MATLIEWQIVIVMAAVVAAPHCAFSRFLFAMMMMMMLIPMPIRIPSGGHQSKRQRQQQGHHGQQKQQNGTIELRANFINCLKSRI